MHITITADLSNVGGRYRVDLWPISTLPVADVVFYVADMVCGRYRCNSPPFTSSARIVIWTLFVIFVTREEIRGLRNWREVVALCAKVGTYPPVHLVVLSNQQFPVLFHVVVEIHRLPVIIGLRWFLNSISSCRYCVDVCVRTSDSILTLLINRQMTTRPTGLRLVLAFCIYYQQSRRR